MKELVLEPKMANEEVLVQFTDECVIDKHLTVKVPRGFFAAVIIEGKAIARIDLTEGKRVVDYGKEYLGKKCKIAFVRANVFPKIPWGIGSLRVNNQRLQEAYSVGAHGYYLIEIAEPVKLLNGFDGENNVSVQEIREKTISVVKTKATEIVAKYFANTNTSIFEISAHLGGIRKEMLAALNNKTAFADLGLKLHDLTVEGVHIPDEDLEMIKKRINSTAFVEAAATTAQFDFDALKDALKEELKEVLQKGLEGNIEMIKEAVDVSVSEKMNQNAELWKETVLAGLDEKLQSAIDEKIPELKSGDTIEDLVKNADKEDDYATVASKIHYNVENNLINKYGLAHKNKCFVIPYTEYLDMADKVTINGEYALKRRTKNGWENLPVNVVEKFVDGSPNLVEMYPFVRYIKVGLNPKDAKYAERISVVVNKIRHPSPENKNMLQRFLSEQHTTKKTFLKEAIEFLKDKKLYIEE